MVMATSRETPHYGGQIGLVALVCMLFATGCVTFTDTNGSLTFLPTFAQSSTDRPTLVTAQSVPVSAPAATFIVKFNNVPELTPVYRNFRRDEAGTRAVYRDWAAQYRALEGLHLVRASYSGELILALPKNDPAGRSPRDVIAALETMDNLAYAEVDSIASATQED